MDKRGKKTESHPILIVFLSHGFVVKHLESLPIYNQQLGGTFGQIHAEQEAVNSVIWNSGCGERVGLAMRQCAKWRNASPLWSREYITGQMSGCQLQQSNGITTKSWHGKGMEIVKMKRKQDSGFPMFLESKQNARQSRNQPRLHFPALSSSYFQQNAPLALSIFPSTSKLSCSSPPHLPQNVEKIFYTDQLVVSTYNSIFVQVIFFFFWQPVVLSFVSPIEGSPCSSRSASFSEYGVKR